MTKSAAPARTNIDNENSNLFWKLLLLGADKTRRGNKTEYFCVM